jgi:hypothetical protein
MERERGQLSLGNIGGGVAEEKFAEELQKVLDNIVDPNTEEKAVREITIKVKLRPNGTRSHVDIFVSSASKLGPTKAYPTKAFVGRRTDGTGEAHEHNPEQMQFMFERAQKPSISMNVIENEEEFNND